MARKIVIIPEFASSHLLKCWIPNVIDSIEPDIIIINSGLFPNGPENKGQIDQAFRYKWCYKDTDAGFDYNDTLNIATKWTIERHNENDRIPHIECRIIDYDDSDVNKCFIKAISMPEIFAEGDIIMPLEPDAFHLEVDSKKIQNAIDKLEIGQGIQTKWVDFLETQFYTEAINRIQPKYRRFAYRFDNMENYKTVMSGFTSQNYSRLQKCDDFTTFHYPWFVYDKWKQLRYDLIYRSDPNYWKEFDKGLNEIRLHSEEYVYGVPSGNAVEERMMIRPTLPDKIIIRPSRSDEGRYAKSIDVQHPEAIKSHPNFVK